MPRRQPRPIRFVSVAAVTTPDPRYKPLNRDRQIVIIVAADDRGRLLVCYPDGDCHTITPVAVSKPTVKPRVKPAGRRGR